MEASSERVRRWSFAIFAVVWLALALDPLDRPTWLLENLPTVVMVPLVWHFRYRLSFSNRAWIQGMIFLVLHTVGSHYMYARVPFGFWLQEALDLSRNHYDRIVHAAFGFLYFAAIRELSFRGRTRAAAARQIAGTLTVILAVSALYELLEWVIVLAVAPGAGTAFLGTQGDEWDAQKDMACALGGGLVAGLVEIAVAHDLRSALPAARPVRERQADLSESSARRSR